MLHRLALLDVAAYNPQELFRIALHTGQDPHFLGRELQGWAEALTR